MKFVTHKEFRVLVVLFGVIVLVELCFGGLVVKRVTAPQNVAATGGINFGLFDETIENFFGGFSRSYSGETDIEFRSVEDEQTYLDFTQGQLNEDVNVDVFKRTLDAGAKARNAPRAIDPYQNRVSPETSNTEGGVAPLPGEDDFEQDYFGSSFNANARPNTDYGRTPSRAELERAGLDERYRALKVEQYQTSAPTPEVPENIDSFRSSYVSQSEETRNPSPFVDPNYGVSNEDIDAIQPTWWRAFSNFFASLFGA